MLDAPNTDSPANVDAAKAYREWNQSNDYDCVYMVELQKMLAHCAEEAKKDNVKIPTTHKEYMQVFEIPKKQQNSKLTLWKMDDEDKEDEDVFDPDSFFCDEEEDDDEEEDNGDDEEEDNGVWILKIDAW